MKKKWMQREEKIQLICFQEEYWCGMKSHRGIETRWRTPPYLTTLRQQCKTWPKPSTSATTSITWWVATTALLPNWRMQLYVSPYVCTRLTFHEFRRCFLKNRISGVRGKSQVWEHDFGNFRVKERKKVIKEIHKKFWRVFLSREFQFLTF